MAQTLCLALGEEHTLRVFAWSGSAKRSSEIFLQSRWPEGLLLIIEQRNTPRASNEQAPDSNQDAESS